VRGEVFLYTENGFLSAGTAVNPLTSNRPYDIDWTNYVARYLIGNVEGLCTIGGLTGKFLEKSLFSVTWYAVAGLLRIRELNDALCGLGICIDVDKASPPDFGNLMLAGLQDVQKDCDIPWYDYRPLRSVPGVNSRLWRVLPHRRTDGSEGVAIQNTATGLYLSAEGVCIFIFCGGSGAVGYRYYTCTCGGVGECQKLCTTAIDID
jgi:hypothetical protein